MGGPCASMSLLFLLVFHQAAPCPVPPAHSLEALQQAVERDRELVTAIDRTLTCRQGGTDCAADVAQCTTTLKTTTETERTFDEGAIPRGPRVALPR